MSRNAYETCHDQWWWETLRYTNPAVINRALIFSIESPFGIRSLWKGFIIEKGVFLLDLAEISLDWKRLH